MGSRRIQWLSLVLAGPGQHLTAVGLLRMVVVRGLMMRSTVERFGCRA